MRKITSLVTSSSFESVKTLGHQTLANLAHPLEALRTSNPQLFLREFLLHPANVGAIWPSSAHLARCMACAAPIKGNGLIVELGAGTGVVTKALLDSGIEPHRLRVLEQSPVFAQLLRHQFPTLAVLQANAATLADLLHDDLPVEAIVSSLPLRSLPEELVTQIVDQWRQVLQPGGWVVQFSYALHSSPTDLLAGFSASRSNLVWRNIPPAKVMVYCRCN